MLIAASLRVIAGKGTDGDKSDLMHCMVDDYGWHESWRNDISDPEQLLEAAIQIITNKLGE